MMTNSLMGQIGEAEFMLECLRRGISISKPFSTQSRYDFVSEYNGITYKIQVKTTKQGRVTVFKKSKSSRYKLVDIDFFAIVYSGVWFIVPSADLLGRTAIRLNKNGINHDKYKNKWELLKS